MIGRYLRQVDSQRTAELIEITNLKNSRGRRGALYTRSSAVHTATLVARERYSPSALMQSVQLSRSFQGVSHARDPTSSSL
jgi:hypothetical protein